MKIYEVLLEILNQPKVLNNYRKLKNLYAQLNCDYEASVIGYLIEKKSTKNNESIDNSNTSTQ
jgi:hypothetical protein